MRTAPEPGTGWSLQFHQYEHKIRCYGKGVEAEFEGQLLENGNLSRQDRFYFVYGSNNFTFLFYRKKTPTSQGVRKLER